MSDQQLIPNFHIGQPFWNIKGKFLGHITKIQKYINYFHIYYDHKFTSTRFYNSHWTIIPPYSIDNVVFGLLDQKIWGKIVSINDKRVEFSNGHGATHSTFCNTWSIKMNVYKLFNNSQYCKGCDTFSEFIIIAPDEKTVRILANKTGADEINIWLKADFSKCIKLGIFTNYMEYQRPSIICSSFNAG